MHLADAGSCGRDSVPARRHDQQHPRAIVAGTPYGMQYRETQWLCTGTAWRAQHLGRARIDLAVTRCVDATHHQRIHQASAHINWHAIGQGPNAGRGVNKSVRGADRSSTARQSAAQASGAGGAEGWTSGSAGMADAVPFIASSSMGRPHAAGKWWRMRTAMMGSRVLALHIRCPWSDRPGQPMAGRSRRLCRPT